MADTGLGSNNMDKAKKNEIHSKGGQASKRGSVNASSSSNSSNSNASGAAGHTEAAKRGGQNSHRN